MNTTSKFYIFGVPKGYSFKGDDNSKRDFFQKYYDGSQDNAKLVISRNSNGTELIYSYLRYRFLDISGRGGGFLGMSISLEKYYCSDIKTLFEFFDFLYTKLIELEIVQQTTRDNQFQAKFLIDDFGSLEQSKFNRLKSIIAENINSLALCKIKQPLNRINDNKSVYCTGYNIDNVNNLYWEAINKYNSVCIYSEIRQTIVVLDNKTKNEYNETLNNIRKDLLENASKLSNTQYITQISETLKKWCVTINKDQQTYPDDNDLKKISTEYSKSFNEISKLLEQIKPDPETAISDKISDKYQNLKNQIHCLKNEKDKNKLQNAINQISEDLNNLKYQLDKSSNYNREFKDIHQFCQSELDDLKKSLKPTYFIFDIIKGVKNIPLKTIAIVVVLVLVIVALLYYCWPENNPTINIADEFDKNLCKLEIVDNKWNYQVGDTLTLKASNYFEEHGCEIKLYHNHYFSFVSKEIQGENILIKVCFIQKSTSSALPLAEYHVNGKPIDGTLINIPIISDNIISTTPPRDNTDRDTPSNSVVPDFKWEDIKITYNGNVLKPGEENVIEIKLNEQISFKVSPFNTKFFTVDLNNSTILGYPVKGLKKDPKGVISYKITEDNFNSFNQKIRQNLGATETTITIDNLFTLSPKTITGTPIKCPTVKLIIKKQ